MWGFSAHRALGTGGWTGSPGVTLGPLFLHSELQEASDLADLKALWGRQGWEERSQALSSVVRPRVGISEGDGLWAWLCRKALSEGRLYFRHGAE